MAQTFTLSIETTEGKSFINGFHLGTQEPLARQIAEEKFHARRNNGLPVVTVALLLGNKMVDCYDGQWFNDQGPLFAEGE